MLVKYTHIGIICECGIASSAMGAAVLRRVLNENGLGYINVKAYATGFLDLEAELFICQKDYYNHVKEQLEDRKFFLMDSLFDKEEYQALVGYLLEI